MIVADLLEKSRWKLKFNKHDQLSAHKIPSGERIGDLVRIRDIAHLGTVVIKCTETRAKYEDAATHKGHGIAEKQDRNSKKIRFRGDMSESGPTKRDDTKPANMGEIRILNLKLNYFMKNEGFVFEIVPADYTSSYKVSESSLTFFSEKEHKVESSTIRVTPYWSTWQPRKALPCWGVRINNNVHKDNPSKESYGNRNQKTSKTSTAIVTKTSFHQVREFCVNVTLNEEAVKEAKKILKAWTKQKRQNIIKKFNDKYCSFVYSGKFSVGAWFGTVATAWRFKGSKEHDSTNLKKCAAEETEHYWSSEIQTSQPSSYRILRNGVRVRMHYVSDPPSIEKMYVGETIREIKNCTVFPANWDEKSHFIPVYEIMKSQAEANKDEDLQKVADIFKKCMKGKTKGVDLRAMGGHVPPIFGLGG